MKAPDKIYIHEASAEQLAEPHADYHFEYIRKDAILDLLQSEKQEAAQCSTGAYNWICEIIDKVNSL